MEGVIQRGTGIAIKEVGKHLAGKTGTTNEAKDLWFVGYSPNLAFGVFMGYDKPRSLGDSAQAALYTAPIFRDFMKMALKDTPDTPFRVPAGHQADFGRRAHGHARDRAGLDPGSLQARHRAARFVWRAPRNRLPSIRSPAMFPLGSSGRGRADFIEASAAARLRLAAQRRRPAEQRRQLRLRAALVERREDDQLHVRAVAQIEARIFERHRAGFGMAYSLAGGERGKDLALRPPVAKLPRRACQQFDQPLEIGIAGIARRVGAEDRERSRRERVPNRSVGGDVRRWRRPYA